jgi:acyl carrier protein
MNTNQFLDEFADVALAPREQVSLDTPLESLEMWDSMAQVSAIAMIDEKLGAQLPTGSLGACKTVGDIIKLVKDRLTD